AFVSDRLVGDLALKLVALRVLGVRTFKLEVLATDGNDRRRVVSRPEDLGLVTEAFYNFVIGKKGGWSFFYLGVQDGKSSLFPAAVTVDFKGYLVRSRTVQANRTISIRWSTLGEYFKALSRGSRSNVRRQMRKILAAGDVEFIESSDPITTPAVLELYRKIEPYSWKSRSNEIIGPDPRRVEYFNGLLDPRQPMRVSIHVLLLDKLPIAGVILGGFEEGLY